MVSWTNRLLAFSRRQNLEPCATNIDVLVDGMTDLLRRTLGEAVDIRFDVGEAALGVLVDPNQLESALLNLAINARDAMPEGGRLTIRCAPATAGARKIADKVVMTPGRYVALVVEDTGSGIPPEVLEHVFEPFFTTKEVGQGSGLGLSMVYGFVKQTGGYIDISSEVGRGNQRHHLPSRARWCSRASCPELRAGGHPARQW